MKQQLTLTAILIFAFVFLFSSCENDSTDSNTIMYSLRDTGPAGGLIFYDKGSYSDGWRYLEAAPSDQASAIWGCLDTNTGADGVAVGTGKQNTINIENGCATVGTAADICANLSIGEYSDWFLPSKGELDLMHDNLLVFGVGEFNNIDINSAIDRYWSSSEDEDVPARGAWNQVFGTSYHPQFTSLKNVTKRVRAVRSF